MCKQNVEMPMSGKEQAKITCIERKYKVKTSRVSYTVVARKELDEDITEKLLHEDMELKTFLANYEITSVMLPVQGDKQKDVTPSGNENGVYIEKCKDETRKPGTVRTKAKARRELIDFLDLPEEFTVTDYKRALEEKGIKVTNTAMPYDDLRYLEQIGKVSRAGMKEVERGKKMVFFKRHTKGDTYMDSTRMEEDRIIQSLKDGQRAILGTFIG